MDRIRQLLSKPEVKYPLFILMGGLWILGLMDQMESSYKLGQYIGISLLMAAIFAFKFASKNKTAP